MIACSDSFAPPSAVTNLRVVGARIDVQGAPERANPSPGDDVQASILVIDQGPLPSLTWAFVACVPAATRIGVPICGTDEPCDGCVGPQPGDELALPVIRFQVPSQEKLDAFEAREVLLLGVVCGEGSPSVEAIEGVISGETNDLMPCEDDDGLPIEDGGRVVTVQIPIERDPENPNLNPEILNDILLNERAWPPPYADGVPRDEPLTGCKLNLDGLSEADRAKHPVAGDPPLPIDLGVPADNLQSFTIDGIDSTEEMQVSWLADGGGFEVAFSFITQAPTLIRTRWQPFSNVDPEGRLVRFNFVVRDGRGGLDRVERGLCVLPAESAGSPP